MGRTWFDDGESREIVKGRGEQGDIWEETKTASHCLSSTPRKRLHNDENTGTRSQTPRDPFHVHTYHACYPD